jgi:hypothetical protein
MVITRSAATCAGAAVGVPSPSATTATAVTPAISRTRARRTTELRITGPLPSQDNLPGR